MKFNQTMKKLMAYICVVVMTVASMAGYQAKVSAAAPDGFTDLTEEKWHPLGETVDTTIGDDKQPASKWNVYTGNTWSGIVASVKDGQDDQDTVSIYVEKAANEQWGLQLGRVFKGQEAGKQYAYRIDYTIDGAAAKWIGVATADEKGEVKVVKALGSIVGQGKTFKVTKTAIFDPSEEELTKYVSWLETDRNLAFKKTASVSSHKEGTGVGSLTDGVWDKWNGNYEGINTPGYFEVDLGQEYAASSIDQVVVWFRNGSNNLYPSNGFDIQFGNLVFDTVSKVTKMPAGADGAQADGSQYMVATTMDKENLKGNVRKVRININQAVAWGAQVTEIAVFSENPQGPVEVEPADNPAKVDVSSETSKDFTGNIKFNITAGENQDGYKYAVFVDNSETASFTDCVAGRDYTITGVSSGKHTIKVVSSNNGFVSDGLISTEVEVKTVLDDFKDYTKNFAYMASWELMGGQSSEGEGSITNGIVSGDDYATPTKGTDGSYFIIDIGEECNAADIDSIYTCYRIDVGGCYPGDGGMLIEYSTDKENWTKAATISQVEFNKQHDAQKTAPFGILADVSGVNEGTVRYVKVSCPKAVGYGMQVTEIAILGAVPESMRPHAPAAPTGLNNKKGENIKENYNFIWEAVEGSVTYNLYVNDIRVNSEAITTTSYNTFDYFALQPAGKYTVSVTAVEAKAGLESEKISIEYENVELKPTVSSDGNYMEPQNWKLYVGADWAYCDGELTQSAGNISGSFVTTGGNWKGGEWGIQATSEKIIVNPGVEYTYSADISASKDMVVRIQFGETVEEIQVKAGEKKTYKKNFKAEQKVFDFIWIFGGGETGEVKNVDFTVSNHRIEVKKDETTTKEVPTTKETPTEVTTSVPKKITVPKASVKSATKKKAAKKVKLTLKKLKGVKYQVQISKSKKFSKKNVLVKKTVKKVKFSLTSKKIKNKKKLYVRVRAMKVVKGKTYTGKWSNPKKS